MHYNTISYTVFMLHITFSGSVRCGTIDVQATPLVTNGQRTLHGQWPWHTAIYQSKGTDLSYKCGGSLISKNSIITGK